MMVEYVGGPVDGRFCTEPNDNPRATKIVMGWRYELRYVLSGAEYVVVEPVEAP